MSDDDPYADDPYADEDPGAFVPDPGETPDSFPSVDEIPESDPDMWSPAPGEVPGTGGMVFPDEPDQQVPEYPDVVEPTPEPSYDSSQGPPPGWEVIDAYGNPTGYDAYGNPAVPVPVETLPQSPAPVGWEVIDANGNPTGYDSYGNPVR